MWRKLITNFSKGTKTPETPNYKPRKRGRNLGVEKLTIAVLALSLNLAPLAAWAQEIVLGMSAAFKGSSRALGIELYRGSMAYIEHVNRNGGINGRQLAIRAYDDGYNPIPTIKNTIRLIEKDKVFLLFNYVGTPTVTRMLPLLTQYRDRHIYLFFPFTGAQPQRQYPYQPFVFNLRASYRQETEGLVENFVKIGRKRIAVFYQADAYGRSGWDGVKRGLAKSGLHMAAEATYRRGTPYSASFQEQVEILRAASPDAIVSIGAYNACAGFIRDARNAGVRVPIANISFVGSESLLNLLLKSSRETGKDYTINLINSEVVPSYEDTRLPAVREYRQLMDKYNPMPPAYLLSADYEPLPYSFVSFEGFLNAKLLVETLKEAMASTAETISIGARGPRVRVLQQLLQDRGFEIPTIDGRFGPSTQGAVMDFQRSIGLKVNGQIDSVTRAALSGTIGDRLQMKETMEAMANLDLGIDVPLSFAANKHQGLDRVYYSTIENGRFVPLENWQRWAK